MKGLHRTLALLCATALVLSLGVTALATPVEGRKIDVWDLTGQLSTDSALYTDHITPAAWAASGVLVDGTLSVGETVSFGDLSITHNANDRIYSAVDSPDWAGVLGGNAQDKYGNTYDDSYQAQGGWYCNGSGGESRRFMTLGNVRAGDKIVLYMGSASGDILFHLDSQSGGQAETVSVPGKEFGRFAFVAREDGTYKLWTDPAGKAMFHRIVRMPGVAVSGHVAFPAGFNIPERTLKFVDQQTRQEIAATLNADGSFSATLAPGQSYNAALVGATGWGFTAGTRQVNVTEADALTGKTGMTLQVEVKSTYTYSGKVTGFAQGYDLSKLELTMVPEEGSGSQPVALSVDPAAMTFSGVLDPSVIYTVSMEGANDYVVAAPAEVSSEGVALTLDIAVEPKATHSAAGKFLGPDGVAVTALTFENVDDGYTYPAALTAQGYTATLRDGSYLAKATTEGYSTQTHVVVDGKAVTKDLLFVSNAQPEAAAWTADVYVGYPGKSPNYPTLQGAVDAVSRMGVDSEEKRVTIHIAPGTYREQVIVDTPYISFVNDEPTKEVLLTWYYGIGYQYYSAGPDGDGYYDPQRAFDQFEKHVADRWGTAVRIKPGAVGFRAENITFENSFNRYITDEELQDGVEPTGETLKVPRNYASDVTSKALTERATAVCVEAGQCEFYHCAFLSSQDTLYTAADAYFKNCLIEGQTDYIFGSGNVVFDGCELRWKGYSDTEAGGYITAQRSEKTEKGYLFRSCAVTANPALTVTPGNFGRPWGADAAVSFQGTWLEAEGLADGWAEMSGNKPENARFAVLDAVQATPADYLGTWTPHYYIQEAQGVVFETAPIVTDNGDINLPYPGHTLTVGYSLGTANNANDASRIQWSRLSPDGTETLVKTATAVAGRSYQITREDVGAKLKVTVTPATLGGQTGGAKSYTLTETVKDGWDDPAAAPGDAVLGQGVNIFLAGDSTVKDYSAQGMYNDGKNQAEGSWGEFLQSFFDPGQVTVVNYANGGRSTRNFINEGTLDKIAKDIKAGDYLFIQFGHNDASNADASHLTERHAPLGTPDQSGVYPSTPGIKQPTPAGLPAAWGETCYTYDCGGTYKWYLQQYIDVARAKGAIPVLMTPVSRMYYEPDGSIRPHHDESTSEAKNNAYCTAVRQLANQQNVLCIDAFSLTEKMFIDSYQACGKDTYGQQVMSVGESTHSNKLGGMVEAALVAGAVQDLGVDISRAVKAPAKVLGQTPKGETAFLVDGQGKLTAYDMLQNYAEAANYWTAYGQSLFDAIAAKAEGMGEGRFSDVPLGHWAESAIYILTDKGILQGTGDGKFSPGATVTHASVAVMLWRLSGSPASTAEINYFDVTEDTWYAEALAWCKEKGLVQGRGDGSFGPNDPITREQLSTMLYRYEQVVNTGGFQGTWMFLLDHADASQVSAWADEAIHYLVMHKVVQGKPGNLLAPAAPVSRAECAVMLQRLLELKK